MWKRATVVSIIVILIIFSGFWLWKKKAQPVDIQKVTMEQASQMGKMVTYKLLVQMERPKGSPENLEGRYERGDVVLIAPAEKEFSEAEKTGFLILKMELTPKQAELLTLSLIKDSGQKDEKGRALEESLKRRKFFVDLAAVGIKDDEEKGREMEEQVYKWEILLEKKQF